MKDILQNNFDNVFTICKTKRAEVSNSQVIVLDNYEDILLVLSVLKESVSVYLPDFKDDDFTQLLESKAVKDIQPCTDIGSHTKILSLCDKIGIPKQFSDSLSKKDLKAEKQLVHKHNSDNVMISKSERLPNTTVFYLKGFFCTKEIILDHEAGDHIESVILTEICRQACLSASEETLSGKEYLIPTEDTKIYKRFITSGAPLLIQVISGQTGKHQGYCVFTLFQNEKCCLKGYMLGRVFRDRGSFKEMRTRTNE
ncbi:hypothetical protein LGW93_06160 [Streptococcus mutans]|nr:hypothetical protein [Streptococcus mutans]